MNGFEKFALSVLEKTGNISDDLDGGWLQDKAEELGLLVRVEVSEPCGENCWCAEYDDFPQECIRYSEEVRHAIESEAQKIEKGE